MKTLFEHPGRKSFAPVPCGLDKKFLRASPPDMPDLSEREVVQHYTNLSKRNFCVDSHFYPLGSCTMKYNPKFCEQVAAMPGFADGHPALAHLPGGEERVQGSLAVLHETERLLSEITGMAEFTLQPMAGAHGEFTGIMIIAAFHRAAGHRKTHIIIPDSAHGTNPASARLAGYDVVTVPSGKDGTMDMQKFRAALNSETAAVMLTAPNTLGVFNPRIREIADAAHAAGALMYYDGANLNAILGRVKPAELGFDVCHLNLHKTFATPHGGGGPGAGPVGVVEKLRKFLPVPRVIKAGDQFHLQNDAPDSIGRVAPFFGNFAIILRAYVYMTLLGKDGLREVSDVAVLCANYVQEKLRPFYQAVTDGRCMHECVFSGQPFVKLGVHTLDIAKALIDAGYHPPTIYFPLNVPEAIMIEPAETESRETLDAFVAAMIEIASRAQSNPESLHAAPVTTCVGRLDEVKAAKNLNLVYNKR